MGSPKALLHFRGESFADRLISLFAPLCDPVVVVLGHDAARVRAGLHRGSQASIAVNEEPERGMLSSLQCGLALVPPHARGVLFTPVDYPAVEPATVRALIASHACYRCAVAAPYFGEQSGHPVLLAPYVAREIMALDPVTGNARDVIREYVRTRVPVDDPAILLDVDTPEAYRSLLASAGARP